MKSWAWSRWLVVVVFWALCVCSQWTSAASTLIGDTVNAELILGTYANQETISPAPGTDVVVGSGTEFQIFSFTGNQLFTIDIGASSIRMKIGNTSMTTSTTMPNFLRNLRISGIDWVGEPSTKIDGFTLTLGTDYEYAPDQHPTGITTSDVTYTDDSLTFDWGNGAYWPRYSWVQIDLISSGPGLPDPNLSINDVAVNEGDGTATFTVSIDSTSSSNVTVDYLTSGISATTGVDYTATTDTLIIPAGQSFGQIVVPIVDDLLDEGDESFIVIITNPSGANITDGQGTCTIQDNDPTPTMAIGDASANEGAGTMSFTVSLTGLSAYPITVDYTTADGSALSTQDYTGKVNTLSIPGGQSSGTISIAITDDTLDELDETLLVNLTGANGATISHSQATGTILDNDDPPALSISDASADEGAGTMTFTVSLSATSTLDISVVVATADGSAEWGTDYQPILNELLEFMPGELSKTVTLDLYEDDMDELDETFTVNLSSPTHATMGDGQGVGTITDNDAPPVMSIDDPNVDEAAGTLNFTVSLFGNSAFPITVDYITSDGSAQAGSDYSSVSDQLTIPMGQRSGTITVPIVDDLLDEPNETLIVSLNNPTNATMVDSQGEGTILDNDATPELSIDDVSVLENAGTMTFTVSMSGLSASDVTVDFNTADVTATAGSDYTALLGTLTIISGQDSNTITIAVLNDILDEPNETFTLNLDNPVNAILADVQAIGTLIDNDVVLTTSTVGGGIVINPGQGDYPYEQGQSVDVLADPNAHYHFVEWRGSAVDANKVADPCAAGTMVLMDDNYTLVAVFAIDRHNVVLSSSAGGHIDDPGEGEFWFDYGWQFPFEILVDDPLFEFSHFQGYFASGCSSYHQYTVRCDANIRAVFYSLLDVLYVDANIPDDQYENGTDEFPFNSIQEAIEVAAPGATVMVRSGTYAENLTLLNKFLTLTGVDVNDANDWAFPVIQGVGDGPVITVRDVADANLLLQGLVITQGDGYGTGGIDCRQSQLTLANCLMVANRCDTVHGKGGALRAYESDVSLVNCTLSGNYAGWDGATLYADSNSVVTVTDSILWDNEPNELWFDETSEILLQYSSLDVDPNFVSPGHWEHALNPGVIVSPDHYYAIWMDGDYHLDPNSPCIDAGDPNTLYDLEPEPNGERVNQGAYGNTPQAAVSPEE